MSTQTPPLPLNVHSPPVDPLAGLSSFVPNLQRRGTMSTVGSDRDSNIPSGIWRLLIHGNCPRCSHRHRAASIQFRVSKDSSEATPIQCERCEYRWLTIGGRNNTETSLLSTQTIDPDVDEISFRRALFNLVRSTTVLDSVPEGSPRQPSRGNVAQEQTNNGSTSPSRDAHREQPDTLATPEQGQDEATICDVPPRSSTRKELLSNNIKLAKILIQDFKQKVRYHFPFLNKIHPSKNTRPGNHSAAVAPRKSTPSVALPRTQATTTTSDAPTHDAFEEVSDRKDSTARRQSEASCTPAKSTTQAIEEIESFDKEALKSMTKEERITWMRERITAFKCHCSRQCTCRRRRSSSSMVGSSTQVHAPPPAWYEQHCQQGRRHSLVGIGSHFDNFRPGHFHTGQPLNISTATRTSDADTAVESNTVNSSPRTSIIDFVDRQRHRSWSPRSASLRNSLPHRAQPRLEAQVSLDSIISGGADRSSSRGGRRRPDRRSFASLPPPVTSSRPGTPVTHSETPLHHVDRSHVEEESLSSSTLRPSTNDDGNDSPDIPSSDSPSP